MYSQENLLFLSINHLLDIILIMVILFLTNLIMILFTTYNAVLAIAGAIKGTSLLKIYKELGFESLKFRRRFRCLRLYKLRSTQTPKYLYNSFPPRDCTYNTHKQDQVETYYCRTDLFKYSFFPYTIVEWNKLDIILRNAKSYLIFRNSLLKIHIPIQNSMFKIHDPLGIKFLTRLRLGLNHLNKHRFRHNFQDCLLCSCSLGVDSTAHFFLHYHHFNKFRQTLLDSVRKI